MTPTAPQTILVVEDDQAIRRLIVRTLSRHGFDALEARSGLDGLAVYQDKLNTIKLVIVDMVMPGMSGLDLAAELERRQPDVKILYISGFGDSIAMESIARQWPEFVLLKPFTSWMLVSRVQQLLSQELALQA